jgi:hypothetical protein
MNKGLFVKTFKAIMFNDYDLNIFTPLSNNSITFRTGSGILLDFLLDMFHKKYHLIVLE